MQLHGTRHPTRLLQVSMEWQRVCAAYMGVTPKSNAEIEIEGQESSTFRSNMLGCLIVDQCPTYRLITNNCQNFSKLLVDRITDSSQDKVTERIETIQDVYERVVWEWIRDRNSRLPGSYPLSILDEDEGYMSADDNEDSAGEERSESGIVEPLEPVCFPPIITGPPYPWHFHQHPTPTCVTRHPDKITYGIGCSVHDGLHGSLSKREQVNLSSAYLFP